MIMLSGFPDFQLWRSFWEATGYGGPFSNSDVIKVDGAACLQALGFVSGGLQVLFWPLRPAPWLITLFAEAVQGPGRWARLMASNHFKTWTGMIRLDKFFGNVNYCNYITLFKSFESSSGFDAHHVAPQKKNEANFKAGLLKFTSDWSKTKGLLGHRVAWHLGVKGVTRLCYDVPKHPWGLCSTCTSSVLRRLDAKLCQRQNGTSPPLLKLELWKCKGFSEVITKVIPHSDPNRPPDEETLVPSC